MSEDDDVNILDDMIEPEGETDLKTNSLPPRPGDPEWEPYVLSQLTDKERDDKGRPSTAGLRRIAPKNLGKIIDSGPITTFNPQQSNDHRATIVYELVYVNKHWIEGEDAPDERVIRVREVADAWEANIDGDDFKKFPTAIASTRAEGRALRKALLLSVAVKEEISEEEYVPVSAVQDGPIKDSQIVAIDNLCKRYNINVVALIKWGKDNSIREVSSEKAKKIMKWLNSKEKRDVAPTTIFGYDPDWSKK